MGGGDLQRCVAEVDCVVWRRAIPHSGGRFGARRPFCGGWRPHVRLAIFGEATWLTGAKVYALDLSENRQHVDDQRQLLMYWGGGL